MMHRLSVGFLVVPLLATAWALNAPQQPRPRSGFQGFGAPSGMRMPQMFPDFFHQQHQRPLAFDRNQFSRQQNDAFMVTPRKDSQLFNSKPGDPSFNIIPLGPNVERPLGSEPAKPLRMVPPNTKLQQWRDTQANPTGGPPFMQNAFNTGNSSAFLRTFQQPIRNQLGNMAGFFPQNGPPSANNQNKAKHAAQQQQQQQQYPWNRGYMPRTNYGPPAGTVPSQKNGVLSLPQQAQPGTSYQVVPVDSNFRINSAPLDSNFRINSAPLGFIDFPVGSQRSASQPAAPPPLQQAPQPAALPPLQQAPQPAAPLKPAQEAAPTAQPLIVPLDDVAEDAGSVDEASESSADDAASPAREVLPGGGLPILPVQKDGTPVQMPLQQNPLQMFGRRNRNRNGFFGPTMQPDITSVNSGFFPNFNRNGGFQASNPFSLQPQGGQGLIGKYLSSIQQQGQVPSHGQGLPIMEVQPDGAPLEGTAAPKAEQPPPDMPSPPHAPLQPFDKTFGFQPAPQAAGVFAGAKVTAPPPAKVTTLPTPLRTATQANTLPQMFPPLMRSMMGYMNGPASRQQSGNQFGQFPALQTGNYNQLANFGFGGKSFQGVPVGEWFPPLHMLMSSRRSS